MYKQARSSPCHKMLICTCTQAQKLVAQASTEYTTPRRQKLGESGTKYIDASAMSGADGFVFQAPGSGTSFRAIATCDVNGDGYADLLVGDELANVNEGGAIVQNAGLVYLVFGKPAGWSSTIVGTMLNGLNGFTMYAGRAFGRAGRALACGDVNGDSFKDLIVGGEGEDVYVVFGKPGRWKPAIKLLDLDGSDGSRLQVLTPSGLLEKGIGRSVASCDVNGDDVADIILTSGFYQISVYVLFGKTSLLWESTIDLASIDGLNGTLVSFDKDLAGDNKYYKVSLCMGTCAVCQ
jgi:hypothetical protein